MAERIINSVVAIITGSYGKKAANRGKMCIGESSTGGRGGHLFGDTLTYLRVHK